MLPHPQRPLAPGNLDDDLIALDREQLDAINRRAHLHCPGRRTIDHQQGLAAHDAGQSDFLRLNRSPRQRQACQQQHPPTWFTELHVCPLKMPND